MLLNRLNLNTLFAGYKGEPALFETELVGGFGWLRLNNFYDTGEGANHLASKVGVNFNFNVGMQKAWTIAVKPALFWDMSMWDAGRVHRHRPPVDLRPLHSIPHDFVIASVRLPVALRSAPVHSHSISFSKAASSPPSAQPPIMVKYPLTLEEPESRPVGRPHDMSGGTATW